MSEAPVTMTPAEKPVKTTPMPSFWKLVEMLGKPGTPPLKRYEVNLGAVMPADSTRQPSFLRSNFCSPPSPTPGKLRLSTTAVTTFAAR